MIRLRAFSRLHFGLLDVSHATRNRYGGGGVALELPYVEVCAEKSERNILVNYQSKAAADALHRYTQLTGQACRVAVESEIPSHVGLGSHTATILAILKAACLCNDTRLSNDELQRLSGRGGTSGVGIHTFFRGGFVIDRGRADNVPEPFRPSSAGNGFELPQLAFHCDFPENWAITLFLLFKTGAHGRAEEQFFSERTPVPEQESLLSVATMYHTIAAAVADHDLSALSLGLKTLSQTGFKMREINAQPPAIAALLESLWATGRCASGMSSMGPVVFAIHESHDTSCREALLSLAELYRPSLFVRTRARNGGFGHE